MHFPILSLFLTLFYTDRSGENDVDTNATSWGLETSIQLLMKNNPLYEYIYISFECSFPYFLNFLPFYPHRSGENDVEDATSWGLDTSGIEGAVGGGRASSSLANSGFSLSSLGSEDDESLLMQLLDLQDHRESGGSGAGNNGNNGTGAGGVPFVPAPPTMLNNNGKEFFNMGVFWFWFEFN